MTRACDKRRIHECAHPLTASAMRSACLVTVALGAACGPKIYSLRADPNVICSGSEVTITWNASTNATLTSKPETRLGQSVGKSGSAKDSPSTTTTYRLDARNWFGSDAREVDVDVRTPIEPKVIGASVADPSTRCEGDTLSVEVTLPPALWGDLEVRGVQLPGNTQRTIHVEHDGKSANLTQHDPVGTAFAGLRAAGTWLLSTPLAPPERCGSATVPRSLSISLAIACP